MEKDIKDYLHLYLGCRMEKSSGDITYPILLSVKGHSAYISEYDFKTPDCDGVFTRPEMWVSITFLKPILRPLVDMTEEEAKEFCKREGWGEDLENIVVTDSGIDFKRVIGSRTETCISRFTRCRPEMFHWLLSRGFDLFGLIESGTAIDSRTLKQKSLCY